MFPQEGIIEFESTIHLEEHLLNLDHGLRIAIVKRLMICPLLRPSEDLEHEVLGEGEALNPAWRRRVVFRD